MASVQIELRDRLRGYDRSAWLDSSGYHARRFYTVNTEDPEQAVMATGLPAYGDPHPDLPNCFVTRVEPVVSFGASGGGWSEVSVQYDAPSSGSGGDTATVGTAWTSLSQSVTQQPIRFAADGSVIPETSREVNTTELVVRAYTNDVVTKIALFQAMANKVNNNTVTFPYLEGLNVPLVVPARQLLARTVSVRSVRTGLVEVNYTFGYGPTGSFEFTYQPEDENGAALGPPVTKKIYPEVAFSGAGVLW